MDKIDISNWNNYFGHAEQTMLYASERYSETQFNFKEPGLLSGTIRAISTPSMVLTELDIAAEKAFQLIDSNAKEAAESVFILKGDAESHFPYLKAPLHFSKQNHSIQYSTDFAGNHIIHSGNFHALTITYDLSYLNALLQTNENGSLRELSKNMFRKENFLAAPYRSDWNGRIAEVIQLILQCNFHGLTRYILIESKMMELFVLQMEQLYALQSSREKEKWSNTDRDKIFAVRDYIEHAYLKPLTLKELIYKFELNEFKLKKGFQYFFQTTVFGYVLHLRMQKAKDLLKEQRMNISEVAYFIGYNNTGSFSSEFKKRFGYSPSQR